MMEMEHYSVLPNSDYIAPVSVLKETNLFYDISIGVERHEQMITEIETTLKISFNTLYEKICKEGWDIIPPTKRW